MKTNCLLFAWLVVLAISAKSILVHSAPTTDYDANHQKSKVMDKTSMDSREKPSSFFGLFNLFHHFRKKSPPVDNEKEMSFSDSPSSNVKEKPEKDESFSESNIQSEGRSPIENIPQHPILGNQAKSSTQTEKQKSSTFSDDSATSLTNKSTMRLEENDEVRASTSTSHGRAIDQSETEALSDLVEGAREGGLPEMKSGLQNKMERHDMLIPARAKMALTEQITSGEGRNASHEETNLSPVSRRIKEYAETASSIPTQETVVAIGDARIPREKVAIVGDVDGNGIQDYVVTNVAAKNYSGTVRLYLMGKQNKFLYTRELVPGKWGFEHSHLKQGDLYGSSVFRLPSSGDSSHCFIAITAPGDRTMKDSNGAVYMLELSAKGNVKNHTKLSASDFLRLIEEQAKEEQKTEAGQNELEKGLNPLRKQGLKHLDGVTSMVFFNASGGVQAVINVKSSKEKGLLQNIDKHLQEDKTRTEASSDGMNVVSSPIVEDGSCLFNRTHCDCKLENPRNEESDCYESFESKEEKGRLICIRKVCPPTYKCSCAGDERCQKVQEIEEVYVPQAKGRNGELYCTAEHYAVSKAVPVSGS